MIQLAEYNPLRWGENLVPGKHLYTRTFTPPRLKYFIPVSARVYIFLERSNRMFLIERVKLFKLKPQLTDASMIFAQLARDVIKAVGNL
jgi:hypothetical protein